MSENNGSTFSFNVCSQCKLMCCQGANPPLTTRRRKIIAEFLRKQGATVSAVFVGGAYSHPAADIEDYCALYDKQTGKCSVHPVKPETCVAGPITFDINMHTRKIEWFLKKGSICTFAKILFDDKDRFEAHLEAAKPQLMRLIRELDVEALQAIIEIPEPETFKVGENDLPQEVATKLGIA